MSARSATTGPGFPPRRIADDAGARDVGPNLEPQRAQVPGHDARGANLLVTEFRVLVEVVPPCRHLGRDLAGGPIDPFVDGSGRRGALCRCDGRGRERQPGGQQDDGGSVSHAGSLLFRM